MLSAVNIDQIHLLNITVDRSENGIGYCYHLANDIVSCLCQSDYIKQLPL